MNIPIDVAPEDVPRLIPMTVLEEHGLSTDYQNDKPGETFAKALFSYLWCTENVIPPYEMAEILNRTSDFVVDVAKAVVVLSAMSIPEFTCHMEEHFREFGFSRRSAFAFVIKYCFEFHRNNPEDIFSVVLHAATFVYRVTVYLTHCGQYGFPQFAYMCWTEIFTMDMKDEFYEKGGYRELQKYVSENRYVTSKNDKEQKAFQNFLDGIDCLFPKLRISDICEVSEAARAEGRNPPYEPHSPTGSPPDPDRYEKAAKALYAYPLVAPRSNKRCYETEEKVKAKPASNGFRNMVNNLISLGIREYENVKSAPPSAECPKCQKSTLQAQKSVLCQKHRSDSFYFWLTNVGTPNKFQP